MVRPFFLCSPNAALVQYEFRHPAATKTHTKETIMATNKVVIDKAAVDGDTSIQVKILQVPAKCGPSTAVQPPPMAAGVSVSAPPKVIPTGLGHQPTSSTVVSARQNSSHSVMVVAKMATSGAFTSAKSQPQVTKAAFSQVASMTQATTHGRTVVITVPRAAASQPATVAPRLTRTTSPQLPANIQIPPGMMLIRSESGQLMLVSQQALAQAQQAPRGISGQVPRLLVPQVSTAAGNKSNEKVTVIRLAAPLSFQPAPVQKTAVVKVFGVAPKPAVVPTLSVSEQGSQPRIQMVVTESRKDPPDTVSPATLESVKKCKNFLVTLIKLASNDSRSVNMANNVRGLVRSLLEGKLEAEEFTEQLYRELKSTPQSCLVPFLKKSLPAVRLLTADPQLFIQQASTSTGNLNMVSSTMKQSSTDTGQSLSTSQQVIQHPRGVALRTGLATFAQSRNCISQSSRPIPKHFTGTFSMKQPFTQDPPRSTKFAFKDSSGSYKEDDDINDVASMAGVNLREENARILTSVVGSVVQSCQDQPILSPNPVLSRILRTGQALGVTEVGPEVVALVSHATQEFLRGLLEKLTVMAEHRKAALKDDLWHAKVSDVRSQLRFLEEVESLKKKRKDDMERERLLRLARSRSHTEDPQLQQLKQRAKELQQLEEAQLQQREANLTALAAIGPRKKIPLEQTESQVTVLPRQGVQRVTRVMLRDLLLCMEQDRFLCHSLSLYKSML
ncbi:transcription initiation factor TFIID subunit 4-like isoform X2 [Cottoperca gobio]|uniref:Transcription initiation factor TFIID subunit 4-like isoform X2 n=1 Tax=Cottoperca gobio TaxID=56716 RepID=A0A6J2PJU7_COTGO|nr:transcription initiation factor TFIID subunit 4-like isoform X2 [Cottoperca gobio]